MKYFDSVSEVIEQGIEQYLSNHEFKLSDGTIIQSRPMTKVMNPDKTKVLICYGGLRVDGCSLVVQTATYSHFFRSKTCPNVTDLNCLIFYEFFQKRKMPYKWRKHIKNIKNLQI